MVKRIKYLAYIKENSNSAHIFISYRNIDIIQGRRQSKSLEGAKLNHGSRCPGGRSPLVGVRGRSPLKLTPF